jgi:hypothetical protein
MKTSEFSTATLEARSTEAISLKFSDISKLRILHSVELSIKYFREGPGRQAMMRSRRVVGCPTGTGYEDVSRAPLPPQAGKEEHTISQRVAECTKFKTRAPCCNRGCRQLPQPALQVNIPVSPFSCPPALSRQGPQLAVLPAGQTASHLMLLSMNLGLPESQVR